MIPDLDERLKRIIEGSMHQGRAPAANLDEGMGLEDIRRLGQGYSESGGEDLPPGTRVNFAEPDLEVAAPPPSRLPLQPAPQPKVVALAKQPPGDIEAAYARAADREAQQKMAMERGGRELVAGLTRTQAQPVIQRPVDAVMQLYARRRERDQSALRQQEAGNNAARTAAYLATTEAAGPRSDRKASLEEQEMASREAREKARMDAASAAFEETKRHNRASEGIGWASAHKPTGSPVDANGKSIPERRQELRENALKPRPGWEPADPSAPTFRDAEQAKKFDDSSAAFGALQNHRAHAAAALKRLRAAKTPAEADTALAEVNQQMANIASKLRVAEGLNSSDASNHAVDTMLSLTNGSIANLRNFANEGRLDAILDSAIASAGTNLDTMAASNNLRRAKGGGMAAPAPSGKVKVSNGTETLEIDPDDVAAAEQDGYRRFE